MGGAWIWLRFIQVSFEARFTHVQHSRIAASQTPSTFSRRIIFGGQLFPQLLRGRGKGSPLNSDSLAPKPLASSLYLPISEAPCPHKRSISVTSLFPSPWLSISWTSRPCDWEGNSPGDLEPRSWRATSFRDTGPKLAGDPFRGLLAALDALGHADSVIGVAGERQTGVRGDR